MALPAAALPAISSGIGAVAGALAGDGKDKFMSQKDMWGKHLIGDIKGIQDNILGLPIPEYFGGQTYADLDPAQIAAYQGMIDYGQGLGGMVQGAQQGQGISGLRNLFRGTDYLNQLQGGGPQFQYDQGVFDQTMQNLMPGVQGAYDEATRDITRNLTEQQIPGLNMAAAGSGNMASSRAGVAQGIMERGAQDRMADVGSQLYQNALNQAQSAAMTGGQQQLGADLRTQGDTLRGFGQFANIGLPGLGNAFNTGKSNLGMMLSGGQGFQQQDQLGINEDIARFNFNQQAPWDYYRNQIAMLGSTTPAGAGINPQQTPGASGLQMGLQGAMAGLGLYNAFAPTPQAGGTPSWLSSAMQGSDPYNIGWGGF